jgi:DNA-binding LacI/PurR family transcriptional regulator
MKCIAVLVYELTIEYNTKVLDGIVDFFDTKDDVKLIISPINVPNSSSSEFDYQYWTSLKVLASEQIDAYIVVTNTFLTYISPEELSAQLKILEPKPIISVSVPLDVKNNTYISVSCEEAYELIIEHLIKKHNKTKIGYFTAELTYSEESKIRFEAFKKALAKNGLEYNEDFIFHGDFTPGKAQEKFQEKIKSKDDLKFEALLCANDYTAAGVLSALDMMGINCPEDFL